MDETEKHGHKKIKLCVSGAAETGHCGPDAMDKAKELGREIVRQGATTGFPMWSSMGAKEVGGISVGLSPAATEKEHIEVYRLPMDYMDLIIYTGFGFQMRDILLTRSSDAILLGCGRIGTIHEFTVAFEDRRPIGILEGSWDTAETFKTILERGHRENPYIIFDSDPKRLVTRVIEMVKKRKVAELDLAKK